MKRTWLHMWFVFIFISANSQAGSGRRAAKHLLRLASLVERHVNGPNFRRTDMRLCAGTLEGNQMVSILVNDSGILESWNFTNVIKFRLRLRLLEKDPSHLINEHNNHGQLKSVNLQYITLVSLANGTDDSSVSYISVWCSKYFFFCFVFS